MKITTDNNFLITRVLLLAIVVLEWLMDQPFAALATLAIITQTTLHEFVHAGVVLIMGGKVDEIVLTSKDHYVDFTIIPSYMDYVYFSGFIWDFLCVGIAAVLLFMAGNWVYMIFGFGLIGIALCYHVIPEKSDFNMWMGTHHVSN